MNNPIVQRVKSALINSGRRRARTQLLRMSDRVLEDAGFSRHLLEQGQKAWPWRTNGDDQTSGAAPLVEQRSASASLAEQAAIRELRSMSTRELSDLGIARDEIEKVVRTGRAGIDPVSYQSAA